MTNQGQYHATQWNRSRNYTLTLGSLKGEYNVRLDPTVKPAQHARKKVPIKSKPNREVHVCLDPSNLNGAIIRENHKPMTVEEIAHKLARATVYTKADALKVFLQIHLTHEASSQESWEFMITW